MRYKEYKRTKKRKKKWLIFFIVFFIIAVIALVGFGLFQLNSVEVTGNERYSDKVIQEAVLSDPYTKNTLYMFFKYRYMDTEAIPFIDKLEVKMLSPTKVRVHVYEKGVVGYVQYLDKYMYFDREGFVIDGTTVEEENITEVQGLSFSEITLYQKLPVENDEVFKTLLDLTQNLTKNELQPDTISFSEKYEITLYFGEIEVMIGKDSYLEEKINQLPEILPSLEGKAGVLHMETYTEDSNTITFQKQ